MDTNLVANLSSTVDALGRSFTATTYGALATYLTPVLSGLLILYLVFWGFQFWQGRGDRNIIAASFRMLRLAVIFFIATSWGPFQLAIYQAATMAPLFISNNVMLNSVINPDNGKAMSVGTVAADISTIYTIAVKASMKIEREAPPVATAPSQPTADSEKTSPGPVPARRPPANILDTVLTTSLQAAIVWLSAAVFVGYAMFLMLFAKMALWVMLALAPIFIILLMFRIPSRFFAGWLTGTIQVMLVPIFLSTFLSFYILGVRAQIMVLYKAVGDNDTPLTIKDVAPFVLICFTGMFLMAQIAPFAGRIATSTQEWISDAFGQGRVALTATSMIGGRRGGYSSRIGGGIALGPGTQFAGAADESLGDIQDRNAAINRQRRNR
jgi:type IV secretion system protein VirB6